MQVKRGEQPEDDSGSIFVSSVSAESPSTKGDNSDADKDAIDLEEATIIASRNKIFIIQLPYNPIKRPDGKDGKDEGSTDGGGGGGTSNTNKDDKRPKLYLTVTAVSADPTMGTVSGGGNYEPGSDVVLTATPLRTNGPEIPYILNFWSGDVTGSSSTIIITNLKTNKSAAAHFCRMGEERKPCWSSASNVRNPLVEMSIASSGASGYRGGTFGWTRKNNTKYHNGIDLYAIEGTPIYAMCDGVISGVDDGCPNDNTQNDYNNGTGNYIAVKDGNKEYKYAHLRHGSAIAINPRSDEAKYPFKVGDPVYQGDIIGYTGRSGNAYNVQNPHLHLTIRVNGTPVDPAPYLNGTVSIQNGGIYGIICDDK